MVRIEEEKYKWQKKSIKSIKWHKKNIKEEYKSMKNVELAD